MLASWITTVGANFNVSSCFATGGVELVSLQLQQYHGCRTTPPPLPGCCSVTSTSALPVGSTQPFPTLCPCISRQCSWLVGGKIAKAVLLTPVMGYTQCNGDGASPLRGQTLWKAIKLNVRPCFALPVRDTAGSPTHHFKIPCSIFKCILHRYFLLWLKKAVYCTLGTWMFVNKNRERKPEK